MASIIDHKYLDKSVLTTQEKPPIEICSQNLSTSHKHHIDLEGQSRMSRSGPPFPTTLRLNPSSPLATKKQIHLSSKLFAPAPILRFTVGKFSQFPPAESPEVAVLGRSNVGKSSLLNSLFPAAPHNFAHVSSKPGHTRTLNGYTVPTKKFTIIDLPGYGFKGREEWEQEVWEFIRGRRELKKAYLLLDALHGPKDTDLEMLEELAKTGISHQLVLTKLDRASATIWTEITAALRHNPVRVAPFKSAARVLRDDGVKPRRSLEEMKMGIWAPLRGKLGLGCDETILGVSSQEGWGVTALRCSILKACGAFKRENFDDDAYSNNVRQAPIIDDGEEMDPQGNGERDGRYRPSQPRFDDDNPMRGEVFGGKQLYRKRIYRW